ncbi:MAG: branched-chain amino acid transport system substrate-binding protein [Actinomycetota bacterium]|nr:branched-chain amino acid transport system substrate-binding protein [Actinomycetota bacterium]
MGPVDRLRSGGVRRRVAAAHVAWALVVTASGCGSRRAESDLLAAASTRTGAAAHAAAPGATSAGAGSPASPGSAPSGSGTSPLVAGAARGVDTGPSPSAGATGSLRPIKIGNVGIYSGIAGASTRNGLGAIRAWEQTVNAHGGVAGHPVQVVVADDGGDPAQSAAARKRLVEEEHVVAFVGNMDFLTGGNFVAYHTQTRVPVVGGVGPSWYYDSPFYFPQVTFTPPLFTAALAAIADQVPGATKLATIVCVENRASCTDAGKAWAAEAPGFGQQIVYQAQVSTTQPDFTGECSAARSAGATVLLLALDASGTQRLAQSCSRQGYHPRLAGLLGSQSLADGPLLDGLMLPSPSFPWTSKSDPPRQAFATAMATYAPNAELDLLATQVWTSAVLFARAVELAGPKDVITNEDVLRGLWSMHGETLGGLTYPLTFTQGQPAAKKVCYFLMVIAGGKWTTPNGDTIRCR